jgi:hypothetical protein
MVHSTEVIKNRKSYEIDTVDINFFTWILIGTIKLGSVLRMLPLESLDCSWTC